METQVRLYALLEHCGNLTDIENVGRRHHLLDNSLQEVLLDSHTAIVTNAAAVIILSPADHLHGIVAIQKAITLGLFNYQILIGIMVIHVIGHIKIHAADGIHDFSHSFPLDDHLIVRFKTHQLGDLLVECLEALVSSAIHIIYRVDFLHIPGDVHHGISGDRHNRGLLVCHVIACQQHCIRITAASGVSAQHQNGIEVLALPFSVSSGTNAVTIVDCLLFFSRHSISLVGQIRPDEQVLICDNRQQYNCETDCNCHQHFLRSGQAAFLFLFAGGISTRNALSILFPHDALILSTHPAPQP